MMQSFLIKMSRSWRYWPTSEEMMMMMMMVMVMMMMLRMIMMMMMVMMMVMVMMIMICRHQKDWLESQQRVKERKR